MKKVLIAAGLATQAYAPATGALTTANGATSPELLASGALAIYGFVDVAAGSLNAGTVGNNVLITNGTNSATLAAAADFATGNNEIITISQGGTLTPVNVFGIQRSGVTRITKQAYLAPVRQVAFVGYNGTNGSFNFPTITSTSEAAILAVRQVGSTVDKIRNQEDYAVSNLLSSDSPYFAVKALRDSFNSATYSTTGGATHKAEIVANGTQAAFTGTSTAIRVTKGSKTVEFLVPGAAGWVASTGSVSAADIIGVAHANMLSVTFTALTLGSGAGRHIVSIGNTIYNVADTGITDASNAVAIAAAINAGSQATATVDVAAVTIVMNDQTKGEKVLVMSSADDSTFANVALTVNLTTGDTVGTDYKAAASVSSAASFELDSPYIGESGIYLEGTSLTLNAGVVTGVTEWGIKLTSLNTNAIYGYAKQGIIENATLTYTVNPNKGLGTGAAVAAIEEGLIAYRGQLDIVDRRMKQLPRYASLTSNYVSYNIQFTVSTRTTGAPHNRSENSSISIFVPVGQTAITALEAILKSLFTNAARNF